MTSLLRLLIAVVCSLPAASLAAPLSRDAVPEALRQWIDWALHGREEALCATLFGDADRRRCAWPSQLRLDVGDDGGRFHQEWTAYRKEWVPLPGNVRLWPQRVEVDGKSAVVVNRDDLPHVYLDPGRHVVTGRFEWTNLPEMVPVPAATGLLSLQVRGVETSFPDRDTAGQVWLQRRETGAEETNRLEVSVHRLVIDDVPLQLVTRIDLKVSGKGREVLLGKALPDRFVPMALDSPLPARLEASGHLRLQIRAGEWQLQLSARHEGPAATLALPTTDAAWDADEVWVFQAYNHLRVVAVEGIDAVDPQQTELPAEWRHLPAYLMRPGTTMQLTERRRGDADPAPDQLQLERMLWLDFDGGGYTLHDRITGTLSRSWRLEMPAPTRLGRVAVGGQDQFITRLSDGSGAGVEIRQGTVELDADARLAGDPGDIPAVGWSSDFQSVGGRLNLPPGWRLFLARGVDEARPTWVDTWTLFDFFVVLITALAVLRLWGIAWGALALAALGLTFTEPGAPGWIWLAVLTVEALVRVLPAGRFLQLARLARLAAVAALLIITIPFAVQQARQGMYPSLERPPPIYSMPSSAPPAAPAKVASQREARRGVSDDLERMAELDAMQSITSAVTRYKQLVDPKAVVQTGPGLPEWTWAQVQLRWQGPVEATQRVRLALMAPWLNRALAFLRILLLALLLTRVIPLARLGRGVGISPAATALGLGLLLSARAAVAQTADFPSSELLGELSRRLLELPDCHPHCAALPRLRLELEPGILRARLAADVAADTAIPLPGSASQWLPALVLVDGQPATALMQDTSGSLWLHLAAGQHEIVLQGALPNRDSVQIALPLKPHQVEATSAGWTIDGLHDDGLADDSLQLSRLAPQEGVPSALEPGTLPAFLRVERTLHLLLSWQVETRVVRLTPAGAGVTLEIPLLAGESPTTAGLRVADGKAQISLAPQGMEAAWQSTLDPASPLTLQAPSAAPWAETWIVDASPIWHVEPEGIPEIHQPPQEAPRVRAWRPWPGESVTLRITRPEGISGQTLTIDRSRVAVSPGRRATDVSIELEARSSRGTQHTLTLPDGAVLQAVSINGTSQPIRQEGRSVTVPITPGAQRLELSWRRSVGIEARFHTPEINLGVESVNVELRVAMPADRWTLLTGGPRLGPAVLFWSNLAIVLLAAIGLGRVRITPLRTHQWFLLGLGLTQVPVGVALAVAAWPLVLAGRRRRPREDSAWRFDFIQLLIALWTMAAMAGLLWAIEQGLLGQPEMQISGNESHAGLLQWYADRAGPLLPPATVVSVPLLAYRLLMLAWALWVAQALLRWLRWGWECFSTDGYWRPVHLWPRRRPLKGA